MALRFSRMIQARSNSRTLPQIHAQILTSGNGGDVVLATNLITRYSAGSTGGVRVARKVFDESSNRDAFLWNAMIQGYANAGHHGDAMGLFLQLRRREYVAPGRYTYPFAIKACGAIGDGHVGMAVHASAVRVGFDMDLFVSNALVAFYAKHGDLVAARKVFNGIGDKDIVSWNSMIAAFSQNGHTKEALAVFRQMRSKHAAFRPDAVTIITALPAYTALQGAKEGLWLHSHVVKTGMPMDLPLVCGLIGLYSARGQLYIARRLFDAVRRPNLVAYSSIIRAYGNHGDVCEALHMFDEMLAAGIAPDDICFVCVLSACAHGGLVEEGLKIFDMMETYGVDKSQLHYACVVDLLGRAGELHRAAALIQTMKVEPGRDVWGALLAAARVHGDVELAEMAAKRLLLLDPENPGRYAAMAHAYEAAERWADAAGLRAAMRDASVRKTAACSAPEVLDGMRAAGSPLTTSAVDFDRTVIGASGT